MFCWLSSIYGSLIFKVYFAGGVSCISLQYFLCRCIRLALVHDMAECIVGDIAPADNISKEEKHRQEKVSM